MTATDGRTALGDPSVQELSESLRGEVLRDGDPGYDEARTGWNAIFHDARPDLVVRCAGASDVIAAVRFASSPGLDIAVKGGGHSVPGFSTIQGGMLIDLGPMDGVRIDPVAKRAVVGPGWRGGRPRPPPPPPGARPPAPPAAGATSTPKRRSSASPPPAGSCPTPASRA